MDQQDMLKELDKALNTLAKKADEGDRESRERFITLSVLILSVKYVDDPVKTADKLLELPISAAELTTALIIALNRSISHQLKMMKERNIPPGLKEAFDYLRDQSNGR